MLTNDNGLTPADEAVYRDLVSELRADTEDVAALQDFVTTPPLREILVSKDNKAWLLPVNIVGEVGYPESDRRHQTCHPERPGHRRRHRGAGVHHRTGRHLQ